MVPHNTITLRSQKRCSTGRTIGYAATMKPGDEPGDMGKLIALTLALPKPPNVTEGELSELRADALTLNMKPSKRKPGS